ncbi:bifunctional heptose 7-phosphate kinase/heptose 1-phosphate adenyltransferase [Arthrobacter deserti]|uniref:Bifunctional heptose 7-phosphate kinase/heptose 1-phosphate adenyltransferase n=1 Tax=Arthrobacter deserti TaxID=1742687 RepID=A0ABX1JL51_9MICC|nr:bifunctional heptose 7-phosphate kinase/heptose 1-phosphate adenyltransferase [Arthrobacter deserti]
MDIAVVGDVLLDRDLRGGARRLSPDAPVPVVGVGTEELPAGGAGLVATLLSRDGHRVRLVTVLSDDAAAGQLRRELAGAEIVAGPSGAPTPLQTRVRAHSQAVVRFAEGCGDFPAPDVTDGMLAAVGAADVIIVADYGRGLAANGRLRELLERCAGQVPVVWDPHPAGAEPVPGAAAVTPNLSEALHAAGVSGSGPRAAAAAAAELRSRWRSGTLVVTLGSQGALVLGEGGLPQAVPAPRTVAGDPCGAGDRFAASLAVGLGRGVPADEAAEAAVRDAADFLAAGGVASLRGVPAPQRLRSGGRDALAAVQRVREAGGTVVATGGCFDLLHAGHARTLSAARRLGDCLLGCLDSDASVRRLKGEQRPIMTQQDRAELLLSLECVDGVFIFEEDTPEAALDRLRPDIWVKGGDYTVDQLPEAELVRSWGGQIMTVPYHPARSTTRLAEALAKVG